MEFVCETPHYYCLSQNLGQGNWQAQVRLDGRADDLRQVRDRVDAHCRQLRALLRAQNMTLSFYILLDTTDAFQNVKRIVYKVPLSRVWSHEPNERLAEYYLYGQLHL